VQAQKPPSRRRRRRVLIAVLSVVAVLISAGVVVVVSKNSVPHMTAKQSKTEFVARLDDTAKTAGGTWWLDSPDNVDRPVWVPGTFPNYYSGPCGDGHQGTDQYGLSLYGPAEADPHAAGALMRKHWLALGYTVRTVSEDGPSLGYGTQIAVDLPNGAYLVYSANISLSLIQGAGECLPSEIFPQPK